MKSRSECWRKAQNSVAQFLRDHEFSVREEVSLKSGKRIDILAQKKVAGKILHVLVEVKDWHSVSRKKEMEFCQQIKQYLIEFALEETDGRAVFKQLRTGKNSRNKFVGILCLTKAAHFSFRQVSQHLIKKNELIFGIPFREGLSDNIRLYVVRFDFLPKVFKEIGVPLYKQNSIANWIQNDAISND